MKQFSSTDHQRVSALSLTSATRWNRNVVYEPFFLDQGCAPYSYLSSEPTSTTHTTMFVLFKPITCRLTIRGKQISWIWNIGSVFVFSHWCNARRYNPYMMFPWCLYSSVLPFTLNWIEKRLLLPSKEFETPGTTNDCLLGESSSTSSTHSGWCAAGTGLCGAIASSLLLSCSKAFWHVWN